MWEYKNGNYTVRIVDDGTKYRLSDNPIPEFPESIDLKITNRCNAGCAFCHEKSTVSGQNADIDEVYKLVQDLPRGVELAIGGGNPLEMTQDLRWLMRRTECIINLTVNAVHLEDLDRKIESSDIYPTAVGISYNRSLHSDVRDFVQKNSGTQVVIHLIAGVHLIEDLERCLNDFDRVLILGYKMVGRGVTYYSDAVKDNLADWEQNIGRFLNHKGKIVVFDNLAIEQLDPKRFFADERWRDIYMGDDGQFTMYLDMVERKYAISSRSEARYDIGDMTIKDMFKDIRAKSKLPNNSLKV